MDRRTSAARKAYVSVLLRNILEIYDCAGLTREAAFKRLTKKLNEKSSGRAQRKWSVEKRNGKSSGDTKKAHDKTLTAKKISRAYYFQGTYALLEVRADDLSDLESEEIYSLGLTEKVRPDRLNEMITRSHEALLSYGSNYFKKAHARVVEPILSLARADTLKLKQRVWSCDTQVAPLLELANFYEKQAAEIRAELDAGAKSGPTVDEKATETKNMLN